MLHPALCELNTPGAMIACHQICNGFFDRHFAALVLQSATYTVVACARGLASHFKVCNSFFHSRLGSLRVAVCNIYSHNMLESTCLPLQDLQWLLSQSNLAVLVLQSAIQSFCAGERLFTTSKSATASFTANLVGSVLESTTYTVIECWRALAYPFKVCNGFFHSNLGSLSVAVSIVHSHCVLESACLPLQGLQRLL